MLKKEQLPAIRAAIDAAFAKIAADHGLATLALGKITYDAHGFTAKITATAEGGLSKEAQLYNANQRFMNLPPLGSEITVLGKVYKTTGLNTTGTKVFATEIATNKDWQIPIDAVRTRPAFSLTDKPAPDAPPAMTLEAFTTAVNELDQQACERKNADSKALFKAMHIPMPAAMLKHYHAQGLTPAQTLKKIRDENAAEARAEARAS